MGVREGKERVREGEEALKRQGEGRELSRVRKVIQQPRDAKESVAREELVVWGWGGGGENLMKSQFFLRFYEDTISRRKRESHFLTVMESCVNSFCLFHLEKKISI